MLWTKRCQSCKKQEHKHFEATLRYFELLSSARLHSESPADLNVGFGRGITWKNGQMAECLQHVWCTWTLKSACGKALPHALNSLSKQFLFCFGFCISYCSPMNWFWHLLMAAEQNFENVASLRHSRYHLAYIFRFPSNEFRQSENLGSFKKTWLPIDLSQLTVWVVKTGIEGGEMSSISDPTCVAPSFPKLERSIPN